MTLQILFTAFALIVLTGSAASAYVAWRNASELRAAALDAVRLADELDALTRSHRKLAGAFYRERRAEHTPVADDDTEPASSRDELRRKHARLMIAATGAK